MRQLQPKLSVLIITLNEERLLDTVLESVAWADEIVIVDSGSSDRTEEIARRYTSHFYPLPYRGQGRMRQASYERSSGEWILYIDADEIVTPELRASIEAAIARPEGNAGFRMELHTLFLGAWFGSRGWRKEWKTRLFRRSQGRFDDRPVHEGAEVDGPIGTLDGVLHHHPYRDLDHAVAKMNRYSTAGAELLHSRGRSATLPGAVARGALRFGRDLLFGGDFLYGYAGLVRSSLMGYYTLLKYAKTAELRRGSG